MGAQFIQFKMYRLPFVVSIGPDQRIPNNRKPALPSVKTEAGRVALHQIPGMQRRQLLSLIRAESDVYHSPLP